jgi:hypothetical protein
MYKRHRQPGGATNAGRKGRQYAIFNATDGVWAHPDTVSRRQAKQIIRKLKERYEQQGFYAAVGGHIPISMRSLKLIPVDADGNPQW